MFVRNCELAHKFFLQIIESNSWSSSSRSIKDPRTKLPSKEGRGVRTDTPSRSLRQEIDNSIPVPRTSKTTEPEHRSPLTGIKMIILNSRLSAIHPRMKSRSLPLVLFDAGHAEFSNDVSTIRFRASLKSLIG